MEVLKQVQSEWARAKTTLHRPLPKRRVESLQLQIPFEDPADIFEHPWTQEIASQIQTIFEPFQPFPIVPNFYRIHPCTKEDQQQAIIYMLTAKFLAATIKHLPTNNRRDAVYFDRPDTFEVLNDLKDILEGQKSWITMGYLFQSPPHTIYRHELHRDQQQSGAICHTISTDRFGGIHIDRIAVVNDMLSLHGHHDGRFSLFGDGRIDISATRRPIKNLRQ